MNKAPDAFRTISEVADDLELPQHVLRFWETKFSQIKPLKRGGGRRYYRPEDIDLLRGIKQLLYEEGYTIRGLQRIFKEQGIRFVIDLGRGEISETAVLRAETGSDNAQSPGNDKGGAKSAGGKAAVSVSQLTESNRKGGMDKKGGRNEAGSSGGTQPLSKEDRRALQATLYELLECKRLLDQVRGS